MKHPLGKPQQQHFHEKNNLQIIFFKVNYFEFFLCISTIALEIILFLFQKACGILKVQTFSSGYLSLYRWAQQALDTPVDHPLLPLFWQNFFLLYLTRISTSSIVDRCCVGEKFFDGLVNFSFQKKIKRRLQETIDYFQSKLGKFRSEVAFSTFYN